MNYKLWLRRVVLIVLDVICINIACYLALLSRFDFVMSNIDPDFLAVLRWMDFPFVVLALVLFVVFRIYSSLWEYAGLEEAANILIACVLFGAAEAALVTAMSLVLPRSYYLLSSIYLMILTGLTRGGYRWLRLRVRKTRVKVKRKKEQVMIVGAGASGRALIHEIQTSDYLNQRVRCLIDDDPAKIGRLVRGIRVVGDREKIAFYAEKYAIDQIFVAMPSADAATHKEILHLCSETGCKLMTIPGTYQLLTNEVSVTKLRPVNIDDLLGRDEISVNLDEIMDYVSGKSILVSGGGGSIGSELCRQIASHQPSHLIILDIYENNAYDIQQELRRRYPELNLTVLIGSIRDEKRLDQIFRDYRPDLVYHAAAHKHVPLMEDSPREAIKNNVLGTYKLVQMADKWKVKRFVMISTDKAVNPTNIMGASKRVCEMIVQTFDKKSETEYVAVRFGNVLGSNGSVIPLFKKQIAEGGPVTVTHPEIIRYFMTISEAVSLVLQAGYYAKGGEIFVLDMGEPVKILDLAKNMIRLSGYQLGKDMEIVFSGLRPGEKLYEELLMDEEGMTDTPNRLIHIGQPIHVEEEELFRALRTLEEAVTDEDCDIRRIMAQVVPTYHAV